MRYLTLIEVLELHRRIIDQSGGTSGIRDIGLLESAIAQPRMTFDKEDHLYPSLAEKATALGFSIIMNHPFVEWLRRNTTAS
jgi:death-on-curing protein